MTSEEKRADGFILLAEPYPEDDDLIMLELQYAESEEEAAKHEFKFKGFLMKKHTAQALWEGLSLILMVSDTKSAWEQIANNCPEADCHFGETGSEDETH